jgi:ribonuclease Z
VLTQVVAGPYTIRGVSVGGVYTSLHVPELDVLFDVGIPFRSAAGARTLLLSHGHVDHSGALGSMLGIRALHGIKRPLRVIMPSEIIEPVTRTLAATAEMQRWPLEIEALGAQPGDVFDLGKSLAVRAFRTFHPVPSLGYQLFRKIKKLRPELAGTPREELLARREAGEAITDDTEHLELAYATDTLVQVLDHEPSILTSRVLVLESTFLDGRKSIEHARAGCHIHLDEILERADRFQNQHLVLMHVSQLYRPGDVAKILDARVPADLRARIVPFAPAGGEWPG